MNVLKTISYFSIFKYPITFEEIYNFSNIEDKTLLVEELKELCAKGVIFKIEKYYSDNKEDNNVVRRIKGNIEAKKIMPRAWKMARFISKFPYIESVCVSGSLSKGYFEGDSDIDFFIITKKNRLWIARTLLILYKKVFLLNSKKFFCINYFMSSGYLQVDERNRFTATEIATLIPMYGKIKYGEFVRENNWINEYFPNLKRKDKNVKEISKGFFSKGIEKLFRTKLGDYLEYLFMKITIKKWNSKFNHLSEEDFKLAFKSSENVSKHHPGNFQKKVLLLLNEKYKEIEKKHKIKFIQENV
ncbi:nucleotidyltransferase domain-containing protein [Tenacibaculum xiamenense]|uniref:nucleotidyltransferase domain-containing protein n=1 Tax=Tenacibaculum xiamenense TaxID=1261553 RepID=UPI003894913D